MGSLQPSSRESSIFSYRYLATVNLITMGNELCTSAAFGYLPPLLLEAGFSESGMSSIMAMGPFLALFFLPVMGTASDGCRSRFGRRRPFIFALSLGIISALLLIPNVRTIAAALANYLPIEDFHLALLATSVILLDICSQVSYTPIESLLSDPCNSELQRNRSFGIFSLMMSLGACLGYWVMSINWSDTKIGDYFGGQQRTLFVILLVFFTATMTISLVVAHDPPLDSVVAEGDKLKRANGNHHHNAVSSIPQVQSINDGTKQAMHGTIQSTHIAIPQDAKPKMTSMSVPPSMTRLTSTMQLNCKSLLSCFMPGIILGPLTDTVKGIRTMPKAMRTLWLAHLMTCTSVMGFRLYFTDYVGAAIFHGNPESAVGSLSREAYEDGVRTGSFGLFLHSVCSAVFSLIIGAVMSTWGSVHAYLFGMGMFTFATFLMLFFDNVAFTLILAMFTGFANATITAVPYTVLTGYHQRKELYFQEGNTSDDSLHGNGADIALLDTAYILSEVISSFAFGVIVDLTKMTSAYIICSFICGLISCFLVLRIK